MLLERAKQLQRMRDAFALARHGRGTTVLVSGEAGIGKTSLLRTFATELGGQARLFAGGCEDLLTPRTLGPFRDMLRDVGLTPPAGGNGPDRDSYLDVFLAEMSFAQQPAVVMVDDAHWADDASVDVIRYLGRRIERLPALLVVAYRDEELGQGHPLRRVLGVLTGPTTARLELPALSEAAVTSLADSAGVEAAPLVAAVDGNPFYLTEVLAAGGEGVPQTVRDAVLARVGAMPAGTVAALQLLSVVPRHADVALVTDRLGPEAIGPAEASGLVNVAGGRVQFRHELARRAVESSLTAGLRSELNRAVLGWLMVRDADPSRIVHHAAAGGARAELARFAPVAAREAAAAEAHTETVAFSRLALVEDGVLPDDVVAELHELAAQALYALNRFGEAQVHAVAAVRRRLVAGTSPARTGQALLVSSRMHTMVGAPKQARAEIEQAMSILAPLGRSPALAHAYGMLGNLDAIEARGEQAAGWTARAIEDAQALECRDVEAHARMYLGLARIGLGDLDGFQDMHTALRLAQALDHGDYACRAALNLAIAMIWLGRHAEAAPYLDIAENAAREHGLDYSLFHVFSQRSHVDLFLGRWTEAERRLRRQLATDRDPAAAMVLPTALLGRLLARRGDQGADRLVARAWRSATSSHQVHRMAIAGGAVIEHAWLTGDAATALAVGDQLRPLARRANLSYLHGETLRYLQRFGVPVEAFDGCPPGYAAGIAGDWQAAAAAWKRAGNPYEQALELTAAPDREVAADGLRRLDRLGAAGTAGLVRRDLRARGMVGLPRGPSAATKANPAGLTQRQLDVLGLLAEGLTSAEIGARLHLSRRTVDNHVTAILRLLDVATRRQAAALAAERGWLRSSQGC